MYVMNACTLEVVCLCLPPCEVEVMPTLSLYFTEIPCRRHPTRPDHRIPKVSEQVRLDNTGAFWRSNSDRLRASRPASPPDQSFWMVYHLGIHHLHEIWIKGSILRLQGNWCLGLERPYLQYGRR